MGCFYSGWGFGEYIMSVTSEGIAIGWSFGGIQAIKEAHKHKALILIASSPCFTQKQDWIGITLEQQERFLNMVSGKYPDFADYYTKMVGHPRAQSIRAHLLSDLPTNEIDELFNSDSRAKFATLKLPILVIHGDKDVVLSVKVANQLKELNQITEIVIIPGAGHAPFISHKKEIERLINDFVALHG